MVGDGLNSYVYYNCALFVLPSSQCRLYKNWAPQPLLLHMNQWELLEEMQSLMSWKRSSIPNIYCYRPLSLLLLQSRSSYLSNKSLQIDWDMTMEEDRMGQLEPSSFSGFQGILLVVGFVPGLKVDAIPLSRPIEVVSKPENLCLVV